MKTALDTVIARSGLGSLVHGIWARRLTVLAYHRIGHPDAPGFDTFKPNVSATPEAFAAQMDTVARMFTVISMERLLDWLDGGADLPPRAALITFDDGYRDNLEIAHHILKPRGLHWTLFLATDHIGSHAPFFWDLAARCFLLAGKGEAELDRWIAEAKDLSADDRDSAARALPGKLGVDLPPSAFSGLTLDWDQVRALAADGVHIGAHTKAHPILSRASDERARREIVESKDRIEAELGRPVTTFAYPNGQPGDYGAREGALLAEAGIRAAFTLSPGPCGLGAVRTAPLAIRRTLIGIGDRGDGFVSKVLGRRRLTMALKSGKGRSELWGG